MKKLMTFILSTLGLLSCSNDSMDTDFTKDYDFSNEISLNQKDDSIILVSSILDLYTIFKIEPNEQFNTIDNYPNLTKSGTTLEKKFKGYTTIHGSERQKLMFTSDLARILGLSSSRVYICQMKYLIATIDVPNGFSFFANKSPKCGYLPSISGAQISTNYTNRGFLMGVIGLKTMSMRTHILYVESDFFAGYSINKYYPCHPTEVEWNYFLYKF